MEHCELTPDSAFETGYTYFSDASNIYYVILHNIVYLLGSTTYSAVVGHPAGSLASRWQGWDNPCQAAPSLEPAWQVAQPLIKFRAIL